MTSRQNPVFKGLHTVDLAEYEIQTVSGHAIERYENLRTILSLLYALRQAKLVPASATSIKGAAWQKETGSRPHDTQAAHTLPRRLLIGGISLSDWLANAKDDLLQFAVKNIEGTVTTLPSYVNKADSRWENSGLSANYALAAQEVLHFIPSGSSEAAEHYAGVWGRFHHNAGRSLVAATVGASGDVAGVLGRYQVVHGTDDSRIADKFLVPYYWRMLTQ